MKITIGEMIVVYAVLLSGSIAQAQVTSGSPGSMCIPPPPLYSGGQGGYGTSGIYNHASTAWEGALRGWADYWRSIGELQHRLSASRINNEAARNAHFDNVKKGLQTWYDGPRLRRQALDSYASPRATPEEIAQYARDAAPKPLADSQYDYTLGTLYWPPELQRSQFAEQRTKIDLLFAERARRPQDSGRGTDNCAEIRETAQEMKEKLKGQVGEFAPMEYIAAKRFLASVEFEAQKPATDYVRSEMLSMQ